MRTHLRIAATIFLLAGILCVAIATISPFLFERLALHLGTSNEEGAEIGAAAVGMTGRFLAIGAAILALPSLVTGWGVWTRRRWARLVGTALAAVLVVQVPVGTVIGAYLLWVLLSRRSEPWFDRVEAQ